MNGESRPHGRGPAPETPTRINDRVTASNASNGEARGQQVVKRDAGVTAVTPRKPPQTPAERKRAQRLRLRDAAVTAIVTPETVTPLTPDIAFAPVIPAVGMTKGDRENLAKITRQRAKVAKLQVGAREAELLADVDAKLAAEFDTYDEAWADITRDAGRAVKDADAAIAAICQERGVPAEFRPSLHLSWCRRGANATAARRAELRTMAATRIAASGKSAKLLIEAQEADVQIKLLAGGLTSQAAAAFLTALPDPLSVMETLELAELDSGAR